MLQRPWCLQLNHRELTVKAELADSPADLILNSLLFHSEFTFPTGCSQPLKDHNRAINVGSFL